ncbi:uncharacterized protein LOC125049799 [Pieris napi]|uniref:uncharacterized protein LOC125049799 n=1 Tax=Pieris napi TaxID=78633 RepID=UPI001FBA2445|nr:uncharacterized protein LOC125049799 [Pieris napi]
MSWYILIFIISVIHQSDCRNYTKGYIKQDYTNIDTKNVTNSTNQVSLRSKNNLISCPYFKENKLRIEKMVDVWQTLIHTAKDEVPCFKILIRKVGKTERKSNKARYRTLGGNILWENCTLEIRTTSSKAFKRRHFLQGTTYNGVFKNIIIETGEITKLVNENPDQWFLRKNLLIMRDCFNGDIVIFARVPYQPSRKLLEDTLKIYKKNGSWTCDRTFKPIREKQ